MVNDYESRLHNYEQYIKKLKPNTPHYRDTKKHIQNLKKKIIRSKRNGNKKD